MIIAILGIISVIKSNGEERKHENIQFKKKEIGEYIYIRQCLKRETQRCSDHALGTVRSSLLSSNGYEIMNVNIDLYECHYAYCDTLFAIITMARRQQYWVCE